jgi:hypothetical protein
MLNTATTKALSKEIPKFVSLIFYLVPPKKRESKAKPRYAPYKAVERQIFNILPL